MWKLDQAENVAAVTDRQVLEGESPILLAIHYSDDHSWAFLSGISDFRTDGKVVAMKTIVKIDQTIEDVASLPPGHVAERQYIGGTWTIHKDEDM